MNDTFFVLPKNRWDRTCFVWEWERKAPQYKPDGSKNLPPRTGGGLYSTLSDLWKFGQMILNGGSYNNNRIIGQKTLECMTRNHLKPNTPVFHWGANYHDFRHGLGFNLLLSELLSPETINHEGYGRSALYIDPTEKMVAVYFVPADGDWIPEAFVSPRTITWSGLQ